MTRVLAALSGGVDSSVAALMLQEAGHEVIGVFMRNGVAEGAGAKAKSCCSASDARDAARIADKLSVPFYAVDYEQEFGELMDHFADEYRRGRTPSPCVLCNTHLKFGHLFSFADAVGAEVVATGHYARMVGGRLCRAVDAQKDQTYYLWGVERRFLERMAFPLGDLTKEQVRERARAAGLVTAEKPESMEICFVPGNDYRAVVRARGGAGKAGRFVDRTGAVLGQHDGIDAFTVGQRRGLPALGTPRYVAEIRPDSGDVVLVERADLGASAATVSGVHWLDGDRAGGRDTLRAAVKVRARSPAEPATITPTGSDGVRVEFDGPVDAVAPGQAAVFYEERGDAVLGGGWIDFPGA